jgi:hypothetical protein
MLERRRLLVASALKRRLHRAIDIGLPIGTPILAIDQGVVTHVHSKDIGDAGIWAFGGGNARALSYGCARHHERGSAVCSVTVHQPMAEVEGALINHLQRHVLSEGVLQTVLAEIRSEIAAQVPQREADVSVLEAELRTARTEQKRLAKAVALADDVPELVSELKQRTQRIAHLETAIHSAKRTPAELLALTEQIEETVRAKLQDLRNALAEQTDLREVFLTLFPNGLTFTADRSPDGARQVWRITGEASFGSLMGPSGPDCVATPTGSGARWNARS